MSTRGNTSIDQVDGEFRVVGAGFGGIHGLNVLRELGLSAKVLERATDVGGTLWHDRYPGYE